ncbi:MAG: DUF3052 domain-containing protein [Planctomycetes bacterium]|nr:DUF3052 domain-containing protein [Planctomycetota bacterium]
MAGYSGTPLAKKLGFQAGARAYFHGAPKGFRASLAPLPERVTFLRGLAGELDLVVLFATEQKALAKTMARAAKHMKPAAGLWIAWAKKSSPLATELDFDAVQRTGLELGLVDNKVCAIDDDWTGLRFVIRRENRPRTKR